MAESPTRLFAAPQRPTTQRRGPCGDKSKQIRCHRHVAGEKQHASSGFTAMHDVSFYSCVAAELPPEEPVLHSVVHTHRQLAGDEQFLSHSEGNPSTRSDAPPLSQPSAVLERELAQIYQDNHLWKLNRYTELSHRAQSADSNHVDALMEKRLFEKRSAEQDRALRRIEQITASLVPKLSARIVDLETDKQSGQISESQNTLEGRAFEDTRTCLTPRRLELAKHDKERDERLEHRLRDTRSFSQSWLVDCHLQRKYEERECCWRDAWLRGKEVEYEEQHARRDHLLRFLDVKALMGIHEDESRFRLELQRAEELRWEQMVKE